jgi:hypothetical protein
VVHNITPIKQCRICGNEELVQVVDLGHMMLTGVFPKSKAEGVTTGPLSLVKCEGSDQRVCGLLQLGCSYDLEEMYGENYGYRSGLNKSMVDHLHRKIAKILSVVQLQQGDLVIDIGSNDGTTLRAYPRQECTLVGIDPTGEKFREHYADHVELVPDFFSKDLVRSRYGNRRAKVITSFSMFYDLEDPLSFMRDVYDVLDAKGVWVFEQSYMPTMLDTNSYDTICQEHLEYYALRQIKWMADRVGFRIVEVEFNDVNGGSFSVSVAKNDSPYEEATNLPQLLDRERAMRLNELETYRAFAGRIQRLRSELLSFIRGVKERGQTICGLGASTKGNVILQYCGITSDELECIGEVNHDKFGSFTPGTFIPIVSEDELLARNPDYLLVLPWHFRKFFEQSAKFQYVNLVFPIPRLEVRARRPR